MSEIGELGVILPVQRLAHLGHLGGVIAEEQSGDFGHEFPVISGLRFQLFDVKYGKLGLWCRLRGCGLAQLCYGFCERCRIKVRRQICVWPKIVRFSPAVEGEDGGAAGLALAGLHRTQFFGKPSDGLRFDMRAQQNGIKSLDIKNFRGFLQVLSGKDTVVSAGQSGANLTGLAGIDSN